MVECECAEALGDVEDQQYTIAGNKVSLNIADVSLESCGFNYSFQILDMANIPSVGSKADGAITFDSDTRDFEIYWLDDLIPSDGSSADYEVTVIAN